MCFISYIPPVFYLRNIIIAVVGPYKLDRQTLSDLGAFDPVHFIFHQKPPYANSLKLNSDCYCKPKILLEKILK